MNEGIVRGLETETATFLLSQRGNIRPAARRNKRNSFSLLFESLTLPGERELGNGDVPKGPEDSSQAIYCLGPIEKRFRPVGYGMIGSEMLAPIDAIDQPWGEDQTVPYGTYFGLDLLQAINCLATIFRSLWDQFY
jgi:hypothetical protein